jgi:hypothetical protein
VVDCKAETFESVTMGYIRGRGCRDPLVYCHNATMKR